MADGTCCLASWWCVWRLLGATTPEATLFLESWVHGVDVGGSLLLLLFLLQKMSTALRLLSAGLR